MLNELENVVLVQIDDCVDGQSTPRPSKIRVRGEHVATVHANRCGDLTVYLPQQPGMELIQLEAGDGTPWFCAEEAAVVIAEMVERRDDPTYRGPLIYVPDSAYGVPTYLDAGDDRDPGFDGDLSI